ncbi:MAG: hypothetical protein AB1668_07580 [Nanoarchaeota archaeon]
MPKKEVKKLSKNLVLAIDWAAAEYKYVEELLKDLAEIEKGKEPLKNLRKAVKIVHYIPKFLTIFIHYTQLHPESSVVSV